MAYSMVKSLCSVVRNIIQKTIIYYGFRLMYLSIVSNLNCWKKILHYFCPVIN